MTIYYLNNLSDSGGDGTTPNLSSGDNTHAWDTVASMIDGMDAVPGDGAGDTVMVSKGDGSTYEQITGWNTPRTDYLTIQGEDAEDKPIFTDFRCQAGSSTDIYIKWQSCRFEDIKDDDYHIRIIACNYIWFDDCEIIGAGYTYSTTGVSELYYGVYLQNDSCNFIKFTNCFIGGEGGQLSGYGRAFNTTTSSGHTNITFDGCEVANCAKGILLFDSDTNTVQNCNMHDIAEDGIVLFDANETSILSNEMHDLFPYVYDIETTGPTYVNATKTITADPVGSFTSTSRANQFVRITTSSGIYKQSSNNNITFFTVTSNNSNQIVLQSALGEDISDITNIDWINGNHPDFIQVNKNEVCDNLIIKKNVFYNSSGQGVFIQNFSATALAVGMEFVNNLIYNTSLWGGVAYAVSFQGADGILCHSNTIDARLRFLDQSEGFSAIPTASLYNNATQQIEIDSGANAYSLTNNNNIYITSTNYTDGSNDIQVLRADFYALFEDALDIYLDYDNYLNNNADYYPSVGSDLIDEGISTLAPSTDIVDTSRPFNSIFDIGAYEFTGSPTVPPSPIITDVSGVLSLNKPTATATGTLIVGGVDTVVSDYELTENLSQSGSNVTNKPDYLIFSGGVVTLTSDYPVFNYSSLPANAFVGTIDEGLYSEIRYTLNGKTPTRTSHLYKSPITLRRNGSGSDNTVLKYKVFYKGKASITKKIILSVVQ